jgi:recombination associated protein RdgC
VDNRAFLRQTKGPGLFKNLTVYRIEPTWSATLDQVEQGLAKARFAPCGSTQPQSAGWVEPRGVEHGPLAESVQGQWLMRLQIEQKVLPGAVVKRRVDEIAQHIEQTTGRKPGKKQTKELKEQATLELLPMAFTKQAAIQVWLDPKARLLVIDSGSVSRAETVVTLLVQALDGLSVNLLQTTQSAATAMADWLVAGEAPAGFTIDRECELKSEDAMKSVVRYARHALDIDEVRQHIGAGKRPTRLALTWLERVSFTLTEGMQVRKIAFLDGVFEGGVKPPKDEAFDADAAIATGELGRLLPALVEALGGEQRFDGVGHAPAAAPAEPAGSKAEAPPAAAGSDEPAPWDDAGSGDRLAA